VGSATLYQIATSRRWGVAAFFTKRETRNCEARAGTKFRTPKQSRSCLSVCTVSCAGRFESNIINQPSSTGRRSCQTWGTCSCSAVAAEVPADRDCASVDPAAPASYRYRTVRTDSAAPNSGDPKPIISGGLPMTPLPRQGLAILAHTSGASCPVVVYTPRITD
jgi:hypothetical protein